MSDFDDIDDIELEVRIDPQIIRAAINRAAKMLIEQGLVLSIGGTDYVIDGAIEDQLNLIGAAGMGTDVPWAARSLPDLLPASITLTPAKLQQAVAVGATRKMTILATARAMKDTIPSPATNDDLENFNTQIAAMVEQLKIHD